MIFTLFVVRWITLLMVGMILHRSGKSVSVCHTVSVSVFTAEQSVIVIRVPERFQGKQLRGFQTSALFTRLVCQLMCQHTWICTSVSRWLTCSNYRHYSNTDLWSRTQNKREQKQSGSFQWDSASIHFDYSLFFIWKAEINERFQIQRNKTKPTMWKQSKLNYTAAQFSFREIKAPTLPVEPQPLVRKSTKN